MPVVGSEPSHSGVQSRRLIHLTASLVKARLLIGGYIVDRIGGIGSPQVGCLDQYTNGNIPPVGLIQYIPRTA